MDVRIASYNIKCFPWTSPPLQDIVQWLTQNADIVALQEVWSRHAIIETAFAARGWKLIRPAREHHIASIFGSGLAIAWRADRFRQTDARFYPYLSAVGFDALVTKGWFRVELVDCVTEMPIRFINTHMQSDYEICDELWRPIAEPVRMAQALQLCEVECRLPLLPTLIVGDMNTEMCWFPKCGWLTQHCGPTFGGTSQVLDHCATWHTSGWHLRSHRVGRECGDWSDHWPVLWSLGLPHPTSCGTIPRVAIPRPPHTGPRVIVPRPIRNVPRVPATTVISRTVPATSGTPTVTSTSSVSATTSVSTTAPSTMPAAATRREPLNTALGKQKTHSDQHNQQQKQRPLHLKRPSK
jgi:hypothetical protein